jgi:hypothetical protein
MTDSERDKRIAAGEEALPDNESEAYPPVDFNTFVLSLSTSALMSLGSSGDEGEQTEPNLPLARQTIDLLELIERKTRGNLTGEEERLISQVLYDLRLRYARAHAKQSRTAEH